MTDMHLEGILPPIPTPFDAEGEFDRTALARNMEVWNAWPLAGVVVGGSNGEFVHLTLQEKVEVVREARRLLPPDRLLMAGPGELSTRSTLDLSQKLAKAGADLLLVISPFYYKQQMTADALIAHYSKIADQAPCPLILYNVPASTGLNIPIDAVLALAEHENIMGMKDSGGDVARLAEIAAGVGEDFRLLAGSAGFLLPALSIGAVGAVSALANLAGDALAELVHLFRKGDLVAAADLQRRLVEPNRMVTSKYGVPGLKAAMEMIGMSGGSLRGPLLPASPEARREIRQVFEKSQLLEVVDQAG